jgi:hypothetical protein
MLPCAATRHPAKPPQQPALEDLANMVFPFMLASSPASRLNQKLSDSGIPLRFSLKPPASSGRRSREGSSIGSGAGANFR